ncbi:envelope-like protein [Trifolium pratense]|uniref:Envelope-like protein n=1 Tax=Trifolium pratense TaxID=57577 RepID=A0A2K3N3P7_TRIPR|nr:envelope-like protein [Trifolium pratense]
MSDLVCGVKSNVDTSVKPSVAETIEEVVVDTIIPDSDTTTTIADSGKTTNTTDVVPSTDDVFGPDVDSLKETAPESNVEKDVGAYVAPPGQAVPTSSKTPATRTKTTGVRPKKGWSKVSIPTSKKKQSLKRKEASSSDSEYDVEENVPNITPSASKKKLALERELGKYALECQDILDLIEQAGLMTVKGFGPCYEKLVREFLANIFEDCDNPLSKEYQKVHVRGMCVNFSPAMINKYFGRSEKPQVELEVSDSAVSKEITTGKVKIWPKFMKLSTTKLSVKYAILNRIGAANWVPTTHTYDVATCLGKFIYFVGTKTLFDFGAYIFGETVEHGNSLDIKMPIAFPSLLCGIILEHHPDIKNAIDVPMTRKSSLTLHHKLFGETHVPDIVGTDHQ